MIYNEKELIDDIRARLSDFRFEHSLAVARSAVELAHRYGGDAEKAYIAGLMHDVLKEQSHEDALEFFGAHGIELTRVEASSPKLWHAIAGAAYLKERYSFPEDVISAVRYHTTGKAGMSLLEKILFVADFISADRDYPGVESMRKKATVSLEAAIKEGLAFTICELSEKNRPIHPDSVSCYNETVLW